MVNSDTPGPGMVRAVNIKRCSLAWLLAILKVLTVLTTNKQYANLMTSKFKTNDKVANENNNFWVSKLDGYSFQAPHASPRPRLMETYFCYHLSYLPLFCHKKIYLSVIIF